MTELQIIRSALGQLQADPEQPQVWQSLDEALAGADDSDEPLHLLSAARQEHLKRREWDAVARLLGSEVRLTLGSEREVERLRLEAKVLRENLLEEGAACRLFERILELEPDDREAAAALEESQGKRDSWPQLVETYLSEAEKAPDDLYRSSMAMRAAEVELRFAAEQLDRERVMERLARALSLDARNERAAELLELMHRRDGDYESVARVLETLMEGAESPASRVAAGVRAARVYRYRLNDAERAAGHYRRVLEMAPTHAEALAHLSDYYSAEERWDDLVGIYEASLSVAEPGGRERLGDILQIAMLLWKKREDRESAEPWFARLRKLDPANQGMLDFYREYYGAEDQAPQLSSVLSAAQRALPSGKEKQAITAEIAQLAAGHEDAQKAIEQYKNLLRQDPKNQEALTALKQLYRLSQNYHALVELLRQQLEGTPSEDTDARLDILREVAELYRESLASDTALVSVLNQIAQLAPGDVDVARELVVLYEKLGRWRDLLTSQQRLAGLTDDTAEKIELMRAAGRRWLDQFSNVQNATQAFETLLEAAPGDREATDRLRELYKKRRAWASLFKLYQAELPRIEGEERQEMLQEMARLASERLGRGEEATRIYRELLEGDPDNTQALSALEKQAERSKDWATLAEALERRADMTESAKQKIGVLQKLGGVYSEHLDDAQAATKTFLRVLELSPGHARALRVLREQYLKGGDYDGLEALYASQKDWEGLADVLSTAADRSEQPDARIQLSYRAARVYSEELAQPERAFRCYERILAADPGDLRAARALIPIYETEEKWARLPALYEQCLAAESDLDEKLGLLRKLIQLTGTRLVDKGRALGYARAAFEIAPEDPESLAQLEEQSLAARDWTQFVEAVDGYLDRIRVNSTPPPASAPAASEADPGAKGKKRRNRRRKRGKDARDEPQREEASSSDDARDSVVPAAAATPGIRALEMKLASVYDEHLNRTDDAARILQGAVLRDPKDQEAVDILERLLRRDGKREELRKLWDLKLDQVEDRELRISMLSDWANIEQTEFDSRDRAADLYRRILVVEPGRLSAVRALPQLLLSLQKPAEAAEAIEEQREHVEGAERGELEVQLSELYLDELEQPEKALQAAARTLEYAPSDARAMAVLRRLVEVDATRKQAANALAQSYSQSNDARREAEALESALEAVTEPDERKGLLLRLAQVHETKLESFSAAFDVVLKALREFMDDLSLWDRAEALANASGRVTELAHLLRDALRSGLEADVELELCDRAARLHEDTLGDPVGAAPYLERLLSRDPANQDAFTRLKQILTSAERWGELEDLYNRSTQAIEDVPTRVDLLNEVALVCEEIIEDDEKAIGYYERTLEIQPGHESSNRALDRLYQRTGKHRQWAQLIEKRLEDLSGDEALDTELRLAKVQLSELHEPARAIEHVEHVLSERIGDYAARELMENILEIGSLKVRAARALEPVYESRDEVRELVSVLEILWEANSDEAASEDSHERRDLLRRIAALKDERLHDDVGALEAYSRYVPEDALDIAARERFVEIGSRRGEYARVASVLEKTAAAAEGLPLRGEILMQAARIYQDNLADLQHAESIYRRVLELDENDVDLTLPAARALERLYETNEQYPQLAEMLRVQIRLESDDGERRRLLGQLGELAEKRLRDPQAAIDAFKRLLEDAPGDETALSALDRLYESTEQWRELVNVLSERRDLAGTEDERKELMRRQASVLSEKLSDTAEATEIWRAHRAEFGDSEEALSALEALYRESRRWDDLAETYEAHLESAQDEDKLRMLTALGDLRGDELGMPQGALDAYREALAIDFSYRPSRLALERLLESSDSLTQREAAEVLEPVFEQDGDHQRLLKVIEIQTEGADDPIKKLALLRKSADIAESVLKNSERTLTYVTRALREGAGHVDLTDWLERLERVASATSRRADQVALLREIVVEIFEGELQFKVMERIAELARDHLGDTELAREYFEKALELQLEAQGPMRALEAIYEETGDIQSLLGILERRADASDQEQERRELMLRRAQLLEERVQDREQATEAFERIVDIEPDPRAVAALERLYSDASRFEDLIELYQRQLDLTPQSRAELRVKIAKVAARELSDLPRAFDALEAALEGERRHAGAIAELEYLMESAEQAEHRAQAASLLEPIYLSAGNFDRVMAALASRLEFSQDPEERRDLLTRLAKLHEEQKEDYAAALATVAKLLEENVNDQSTVEELERLARVADNQLELANVYARALDNAGVEEPATAKLARRAGELFAEQGQTDKSLELYRRALAFDPEDRRVFGELDSLLEKAGRHEERVELYRSAIETRYEEAERVRLYHQIAALQRGALGSPQAAVEAYQAALEIDPTDATSLDALSEIYREQSSFEELAELYLERAESADQPEKAAGYRLELAKLRAEQLSDVGGAIDQLEEIVQALPSHPQAIAELERLRKEPETRERVVSILLPLYESADDWRRLIKLNEDRFAMAEDVAEKVSVLRETAELWERRGEDLERARRGLAVAFELDSDDPDLRADYERLVEATDGWDELAGVYQERLKSEDLTCRQELLRTLARVHDEKRNDPRRALAAYELLVDLDETDEDALEKLEQLATMLSEWAVLVRALRIKTELTDDVEERASLWRRVGETRRDMLDQPELAIEAYERAAEVEPHSTFTLDCLIGLYQERQEVPRLIELYQRRVELADEEDVELKYELLYAAGALYETQLNDNVSAVDMFNQALGLKPSDKTVLERVNRLYATEEMWPELLENLRFAESIAESDEERTELRLRIGEVLGERLSEFDEALETYRQVLEQDPENEAAVKAVQAIGAEHAELREVAADVLVPALTSQGRHAELVEALEMRLAAQLDPSDRVATLRRIAQVRENDLQQSAEAQGVLLRALTDQPDSEELHEEIERLSRLCAGFEAYATALGERAQSTFDTDLAKSLYARLGRISERELNDPEAAISAYEEAVRQAGDLPELLESLDRLYAKVENFEQLNEVLERRASVAESDEEQAELCYRMATIQREQFKDSSRCLDSLRRALELAPSHQGAIEELEALLEDQEYFEEVAEVLESVYRELNDTTKLAALFERRIGLAGSSEERLEARRTLARVLEDEVGDPAAAQRILQQGVVEEPSDLAAVEELERLAGVTHDWAGACDALEEALQKIVGIEPATGKDLALSLAQWRHERQQDDTGAERALSIALECAPDSDEILAQLEELQAAPGREQALIETLRRRGRLLEGASAEDFFRRAKRIADTLDVEGLGEAILRDLLKLDESNDWALDALTELREQAEDYAEALALMERRLASGTVEDAVELKHRAAQLARQQLSDSEKACQLYAELLEEDPTDTRAADALRALFVEGEKYGELGSLLESQIDVATESSERIALRLELSQLRVDRFDDAQGAIDQLRAVLEEEPGHTDAVLSLGRLYEKDGRFEDLAELLEQQVDAAEGRGDSSAAVKLLVRLGEVLETRLDRSDSAIDAFRRVLDSDAEHRQAIESLTRLYKKQDRPEDAAETLERLVRLSDTSELAPLGEELAGLYDELGDGQKACEALERVVASGGATPELRMRLRELYEKLENWKQLAKLSVGDAEEAEGREEKVKHLRRGAELYLDKLGDGEAAAGLLQQATELSPDDRPLMLQLCDVLSSSGRSREAIETLQRIVESYGGRRSKELGEIHRRLARAHRSQGDDPAALQELDQAFRIEPGNVGILKELGELALDLGELKKAQQMYRALLLQRLDDKSPITKAEVFYSLGRVHQALGELPKAKQMLERAVQTDSGLQDAKKLLEELSS